MIRRLFRWLRPAPDPLLDGFQFEFCSCSDCLGCDREDYEKAAAAYREAKLRERRDHDPYR